MAGGLSLLSWMVVCCALLSACATRDGTPPPAAGPPRTEVVFAGERGDVRVLVEVVASPEARQKGLMYRKEVPEGEGMLFVFEREEEHPFWMKNTYVSLDMVFVDSGKNVVGIVRSTKPLSEKTVSVELPSRYVIELPSGFCTRHGIHSGQTVTFEL